MDISIPELGDVDEVRLVRWLVGVGQTVQAGQELAEVEADKAVFVIEAPAAGVVREIISAQGESARPGRVIGRLEVQ